ncbi:hypothetical protein [Thalassospira sp. UBA1131]|uniref:hypothetical protein n=1 Tax=Thalassospira sp. UBA1131 TaxID=1947672 RepID=UPI0025DEF317|nr:hypothetical protein [Thalassospira sp. UBA1131]
MRPRPISFQAITRQDRHQVMELVQKAISAAHGWVEDSQFYSNKMTTIRFVISAGKCSEFCQTLTESGLMVEMPNGFEPADANDPDSELTGTIQLTFIHDQPDLRQTIPAVPG